jgi:hypothetical protein
MQRIRSEAEHTVGQVVGDIKAERSRFVWLRFTFVGVVALNALALAWIVPAVPGGMSHIDGETALALLLIAVAFLSAIGFLIFWGPWFRHEPLSEFLRVLFGAHQLIRGRQQFLSRLAAECQRAHSDRRHIFSLVIIKEAAKHENRAAPSAAQAAALLVRGAVRAEDIVADPASDEVWVLISRADAHARARIVARLAGTLRDLVDAPALDSYRVGASTYGADGDATNALFNAARERFARLQEI